MNIVFLLNSLAIGGSERKVVKLANQISDKGWNVSILYVSGSNELQSEINGSVTVLKLKNEKENFIQGVNKTCHFITRNNIETVFTVNMYPLLYAIKAKMHLRKKLRFVSLTNTTQFETFKKKIQMIVYRCALIFADHIVFGANAQKKIWIKRYRLRNKQSSVLYNGVDTDIYSRNDMLNAIADSLKHDLSLDKFDFVFCTVAQLRIEKRHQDIIEACSRLKRKGKNIACLFVGGGKSDYKKTLQTMARKYEVSDNIKFIGQVSDCRPYIIASDSFLLASESETFSNAALEAMSLSLPVLMSNVGGAQEMIKEGYNGFLFDALNIDSLEKKMQMMISQNNDVLCQNSRDRVERHFSYKAMVDNYMDIAKHD